MHYFKLLIEPLALIMLVWAWITFSLWRSKHQRWRVSLAAWLAFWFLASPLGANSLVWLLERNYRVADICDGFSSDDVIVVLGGGKKGSAAKPGQVEVLMEATFVRTFSALKLWRELEKKPYIIVSGGGYGEVKESDLMSLLLNEAGVPRDKMRLERESKTTWQNAQGVKSILADVKAKRFYLVTSAIHMPRALSVFGDLGLPVCPWPVDQQAFRPDFGGLWIPSIRPLEKSSAALHEFKGLIWYAMTGRN